MKNLLSHELGNLKHKFAKNLEAQSQELMSLTQQMFDEYNLRLSKEKKENDEIKSNMNL